MPLIPLTPPPTDPLTMGGATDPQDDPTAGLIATLRQLQAQGTGPMIPNNPIAPFAAIAGALAAGAGGLTSNPVMDQWQKQTQLKRQHLLDQATIRQAIVKARDEKRKEALDLAKEKRAAASESNKMHMMFAIEALKGSKDNPALFRPAMETLNRLGVTKISPEEIDQIALTADPDKVQKRIGAVLTALDAGVDPAVIGMDTRGVNVEAMKGLSPDQRRALAGPEYQKKTVDAMNAELETRMKRIELANLERGAPKGGYKTVDDYVEHVALRWYTEPGFTPSAEQLKLLKQWEAKRNLEKASSKADLAMKAAGGDATAARALALLNAGEQDRRPNEYMGLLQAARIKQELAMNPAKRLTPDEKAVMEVADMIAERKNSRPMPQAAVDKLTEQRSVLSQLATITPMVQSGTVQKYVGGPFGAKGYWETAKQRAGIPDADRDALFASLSGLLAVVGHEKFGSAFTENERRMLKDWLADVGNPGPTFAVKHRQFVALMERKYRDTLTMAKTNKWRIPEDFQDLPTALTDTSASIIQKGKAAGKTDAEIMRDLKAAGH